MTRSAPGLPGIPPSPGILRRYQPPPSEKGSQATWGFYLLDGPNGTTRLLERGRHVAGDGLAEKLGFGPALMDPIGFVMSKKMLRNLKKLAESLPSLKNPARSSS